MTDGLDRRTRLLERSDGWHPSSYELDLIQRGVFRACGRLMQLRNRFTEVFAEFAAVRAEQARLSEQLDRVEAKLDRLLAGDGG